MAMSVMETMVRHEPERFAALMERPPEELAAMKLDWDYWSRPEQRAPEGDWMYWLYLAGRGAGKTRSGSEWVHERVHKGLTRSAGLIAPTAGSARDVMIEGPSGIMKTQKAHLAGMDCHYEPSKRKVTYGNGAELHIYSADQPDRLRGANHDTVWADELAAWRYPDAWDQAVLGLRVGKDPRAFISTTPKPTRLVTDMLKDPFCVVTRGTTYDNLLNLSPNFRRAVVSKYEGTTLGMQELYALILDQLPGALWNRALLERTRVRYGDVPQLVRIVVGVDPAVKTPKDREAAEERDEVAEAGIVIAGLGENGHLYVLGDQSIAASPHAWGTRAVAAYLDWDADRLLGEVNNGGDLVEFLIRACALEQNAEVAFKRVTASRGKVTRAEPIAAFFEQGRAHIVGAMPDLEDQLVQMMPAMGDSPDRADAMVWAAAELMYGGDLSTFGRPLADSAMGSNDMDRTSAWVDPAASWGVGGDDLSPGWGSMP